MRNLCILLLPFTFISCEKGEESLIYITSEEEYLKQKNKEAAKVFRKIFTKYKTTDEKERIIS